MILFKKWKLVKLTEVNWSRSVAATLVAVLAAFILCALLINVTGANVIKAFSGLFQGAFGNPKAIVETLVKSTPLLLTALAATVAFRGQVWNIGAEGQLFAGAIGAYFAYVNFMDAPRFVLVILTVIFGMLGGALWGLLAGVLKASFNVDIIISTVMLNYIATYLVSFLLSALGPWREQGSYQAQSPIVSDISKWPTLFGFSRLHVGLLLAVFLAFLTWILINKTSFGYKLRAYGFNPTACRMKGISANRVIVITMIISGGLAGLAGAGELFGVQHRLVPYLSSGFGFTGIIVALLGGLDPLMVVLTSIFIGGTINGSVLMQIASKVPSALMSAIQAIILLFLLAAQAYARYDIRRINESQ